MKNEGLTSKQVQFIKPNPARRMEVPVGPPGLYLVVHPTGKKSWALRYRWHGRTSKLTLGGYPGMSLAGARGEAQAALQALESGIDPAAAKAAEAPKQPNSAESVAEEWLARDVRPRV